MGFIMPRLWKTTYQASNDINSLFEISSPVGSGKSNPFASI